MIQNRSEPSWRNYLFTGEIPSEYVLTTSMYTLNFHIDMEIPAPNIVISIDEGFVLEREDSNLCGRFRRYSPEPAPPMNNLHYVWSPFVYPNCPISRGQSLPSDQYIAFTVLDESGTIPPSRVHIPFELISSGSYFEFDSL